MRVQAGRRRILCCYIPSQANWLLLGVILTSLDLPIDQPVQNRCGSCTRCLDICPTKALTGPYQLDARLCISYLTIEHKGAIPESLRPLIGDHLFGCDDCLDVCPWNRWAQPAVEAKLLPREYPDLSVMLHWQDQDFMAATAGTPIKRLGLSRWKRNICVVLGNIGNRSDLESLQVVASGSDVLCAEHARWAIQRIECRFPLT
ncbi:MAG: tRNA epoxyqueuosine(34) reductase QueG [Verrucomicrobia bacterium]|nr:tRNA epoxyqueuosine(34) reductase QueG [Verrucomicrobiota bacterium]